MTDLIRTIARTRALTAQIVADSLRESDSVTEIEMSDRILKRISTHPELYPRGWYDPPEGGVAVLWAETPYRRLEFDTLRNPQFFPDATSRFGLETVGILYASTIDRATGMIGDIGCTVYRGEDEKIREHIRKTYEAIYAVAAHAEAGMKFSELYTFAMHYFGDASRVIGWMTTSHDPLKVNLGHTIPGSLEGDLSLGNSFEEIKESIRTHRIYINEAEQFRIPATCAFTVEARLVDPKRTTLLNALFHFIVTFSAGKKEILTNFDGIFRAAGMDYLQGA